MKNKVFSTILTVSIIMSSVTNCTGTNSQEKTYHINPDYHYTLSLFPTEKQMKDASKAIISTMCATGGVHLITSGLGNPLFPLTKKAEREQKETKEQNEKKPTYNVLQIGTGATLLATAIAILYLIK